MNSLFSASSAVPLMNAAGTVKTPDQLKDVVRAPSPAVLVGSYTMDERPGNAGRVFFDTSAASLNSLGLPGPELRVWTKWVSVMACMAHDQDKELWVSVAGFNPPEYRHLVEAAFESGADAVEANLGCPNVWHAEEQKPIVSFSLEETRLVLDELRELMATSRCGVKLSPILDPVLLAAIDRELATTHVAFVTCINTVPNCFAFTPDGAPAIAFGTGLGGMSGPAAKWIGLGQVIAHRAHLPEVPIIGVGGIAGGRDVADYLHATVGADACQIATALWQRGSRAFHEILAEFADVVASA